MYERVTDLWSQLHNFGHTASRACLNSDGERRKCENIYTKCTHDDEHFSTEQNFAKKKSQKIT
jgi:hypothetical protein